MRHKEQVLCLPPAANLVRDVRVKNKLEVNSVIEVNGLSISPSYYFVSFCQALGFRDCLLDVGSHAIFWICAAALLPN